MKNNFDKYDGDLQTLILITREWFTKFSCPIEVSLPERSVKPLIWY